MGTLMTPEAPAPATPPADGPPPAPADGGAPPAPEAPPAGEAPPTPPAAPVAPEAYTLTLADGSVLDPAFLERAGSLAKELALPNEAAQKVVAMAESELTTHLEALRAADAPNGVAWKARVEQYERDALADPLLGNGDRAQLDKIALQARLVAEKVGGKEILDFLGATGMGSSAPFLKMFGVTLHKAFGEGEFVQPGAATKPGSKDPAEVLFGAKSAPTQE